MIQNFLNLLLIMFFFINSTNLFSLFYGDIELQTYIKEEICMKFDPRLLTIFVTNYNFSLNLPTISKNSTFNKYNQCFHLVFNNISLKSLLEVIKKHGKFKSILILFDLDCLNEQHFKILVINLDKLYYNCNKCLPFILILNNHLKFKQIKNLTFLLLSLTKFDFRSLIWFKNTSIHIRPVFYGCLLHPYSFSPKTINNFKMLKMPVNKCNLNKTNVNVTVIDQPPFCHVIKTKNKTTLFGTHYSIDSDILEYLKLKYNFNTFLINANLFYEPRLNKTTGKWEGVVGYVFSGQAQLGLCALSISFERLNYVDFTYSTQSDTISFLTKKPNLASQTWLVFSPFNLHVWIILLIILIFTSITLHLFYFLKHFKVSFASIFIFLFGNFLMRSIHIQKSEIRIYSAVRLIVSFWMLSMLILNTIYCANFFSKLTLREYDSPVDTSKDLLNYLSQNKLYMLTVDFFKNAFINAKDPTDIYFKLGQYINQTKPELALPNIFKMSSQIKKHWANFVYIDNKIVLINMVNHFGLNKMHISKENIGIDNMGIALTKKSTLLLPFNFA